MNWFTKFLTFLDNLLIDFYHDPHVVDVKDLPMNQPIPVTPKPTLEAFMTAMRDFEGNVGDLNYRMNNPLNCRCSAVGYAKIYGDVHCVDTGKSGKFAFFPTYQLGWLYAENLIKQRIKMHPKWTIVDFIGHPTAGWSPASDGNPVTAYAAFIGKRINVDPNTFTIDQLV